jgi:hypothetical protein
MAAGSNFGAVVAFAALPSSAAQLPRGLRRHHIADEGSYRVLMLLLPLLLFFALPDDGFRFWLRIFFTPSMSAAAIRLGGGSSGPG